MAKSRLNMNDYITEIKALERELNDEKTPQLVGSEQIVMKLSETNSRWDMSIIPYRQGQALSNDGWNVCIVTARALNSGNLVASLAVESSVDSALEKTIDIPLPPSQSSMKKWFIPVFGPKTQPIQLKFQVIANDDCSISFEEWTPWQ